METEFNKQRSGRIPPLRQDVVSSRQENNGMNHGYSIQYYIPLWLAAFSCYYLVEESGTSSVEQNIDRLGEIAYESTQLLSLADIISLLTNHI